jgi:hypothetical protein
METVVSICKTLRWLTILLRWLTRHYLRIGAHCRNSPPAAVSWFIFCFIFCAFHDARSADDPSPVDVGVHVLTIENLNARAQSFEAQFYFYLTWYGTRNPEGLEFTNGKDVQRLIQVQQSDSVGTTLSCRARGTFRSQMDFSDYPMDRHTLRIEIEDFNYTEAELGYRVDKANTGVSPEVSLDGWAIGETAPTITSKPFGSANQRFSHYEYAIAIRRLLSKRPVPRVFPCP